MNRESTANAKEEEQMHNRQETATIVVLPDEVGNLGKSSVVERRERKRYCGGRMGFCGFVCAIITVVVLVLLAVMIPVTYCILVPKAVQAEVDGIIASSDRLVSGSFSLNLTFFLIKLNFTPFRSQV
jgi:hypothetical protein